MIVLDWGRDLKSRRVAEYTHNADLVVRPNIHCDLSPLEKNTANPLSLSLKYTPPPLHIHLQTCTYIYKHVYPPTEEIRLKIFGSPDLSVFFIDHLSDRDSEETLFEIFRNPVTTCWTWTGTHVKTCWTCWQS